MTEFINFRELRDTLEAEGRCFDAESLRSLRYGDLMLASIGNARKAMCAWEMTKEEEARRLAAVDDEALERLDEVAEDSHMLYALYARRAEPIERENAPKWRQLVQAMRDLRGDWSEARNSDSLAAIYNLLPAVEEEGLVPQGWLAAVRANADQFDGHFNDGRIMRDGALHLPEEAVAAMGLPQEMAGDASGNLARMIGARSVLRAGGFLGGYEELFESILTPAQRVIYAAEFVGDAEDDD